MSSLQILLYILEVMHLFYCYFAETVAFPIHGTCKDICESFLAIGNVKGYIKLFHIFFVLRINKAEVV